MVVKDPFNKLHLGGPALDVSPTEITGPIPAPAPRKPVHCTLVVHINAHDRTGVARVEDWGPLLTEQLPAFLAGSKVIVRPIIDPTDIRPVDSYETPATMRFALEQRNPVDVFPYATLKASRCDADHTNHYQEGQAGQTHLGNLGPLSRKTHRAKTHGKWKLEQPTPGVFHWTSPHGYQYRVTAAELSASPCPRRVSDSLLDEQASPSTPRRATRLPSRNSKQNST